MNHRQTAEELLRRATSAQTSGEERDLVARAQVHALLALSEPPKEPVCCAADDE